MLNASNEKNDYEGSSSSWQSARDPISNTHVPKQRSADTRNRPEGINNSLAKQALTQLGIRYRYGGKAPETGFDCSGLVFYSAQTSLGLKLPPRSDDMARLGSNIERNQLQVGDLVFFNTMGRRFSHVGVYLGENKFVHSPASGGVVRIEDMNDRYWDTRFTGARRLEGAEFALASSGLNVDDSEPIVIPSRKLSGATPPKTSPWAEKNSQTSPKTRHSMVVKDKRMTTVAQGIKMDTSSVAPKPSAANKTYTTSGRVGTAKTSSNHDSSNTSSNTRQP